MVTIKACGKILVFGGYAILEEGNVGLVVNVDKGTHVDVTAQEAGLTVELPQYDLLIDGDFKDGKLILEQGDLRLDFLINAVTYAKQYLDSQNIPFKPCHILSKNDDEMIGQKGKKTGLGSSASSTVAIIAAILAFHGIEDRDAVYKISCYSHHLSQDRFGSNYDVFASCYGSHFFTGTKQKLDEKFMQCMSTAWNIKRDHFTWPKDLLPVIIFTGRSASTKAMVEQVLQWKKKDKKSYNALMKDYDAINQKLQKAFEKEDSKAIIPLLEQSWQRRKELGMKSGAKIESDEQSSILTEMKQNGALTAGLVGAGGGDSIIALCKTSADQRHLIAYCEDNDLLVLENTNIVDSGYTLLEQHNL